MRYFRAEHPTLEKAQAIEAIAQQCTHLSRLIDDLHLEGRQAALAQTALEDFFNRARDAVMQSNPYGYRKYVGDDK